MRMLFLATLAGVELHNDFKLTASASLFVSRCRQSVNYYTVDTAHVCTMYSTMVLYDSLFRFDQTSMEPVFLAAKPRLIAAIELSLDLFIIRIAIAVLTPPRIELCTTLAGRKCLAYATVL